MKRKRNMISKSQIIICIAILFVLLYANNYHITAEGAARKAGFFHKKAKLVSSISKGADNILLFEDDTAYYTVPVHRAILAWKASKNQYWTSKTQSPIQVVGGTVNGNSLNGSTVLFLTCTDPNVTKITMDVGGHTIQKDITQKEYIPFSWNIGCSREEITGTACSKTDKLLYRTVHASADKRKRQWITWTEA